MRIHNPVPAPPLRAWLACKDEAEYYAYWYRIVPARLRELRAAYATLYHRAPMQNPVLRVRQRTLDLYWPGAYLTLGRDPASAPWFHDAGVVLAPYDTARALLRSSFVDHQRLTYRWRLRATGRWLRMEDAPMRPTGWERFCVLLGGLPHEGA